MITFLVPLLPIKNTLADLKHDVYVERVRERGESKVFFFFFFSGYNVKKNWPWGMPPYLDGSIISFLFAPHP